MLIYIYIYMGVEPKIGGIWPPKWMVYNNGNPYEQMDDLGVLPYFWFNTHICRDATLQIDANSLLCIDYEIALEMGIPFHQPVSRGRAFLGLLYKKRCFIVHAFHRPCRGWLKPKKNDKAVPMTTKCFGKIAFGGKMKDNYNGCRN